MPVAGVDPGTMGRSVHGFGLAGKVSSQRRNAGQNDGGASSLVGQIRHKMGDLLLFVIMNQRGNVVRFRSNRINCNAGAE